MSALTLSCRDKNQQAKCYYLGRVFYFLHRTLSETLTCPHCTVLNKKIGGVPTSNHLTGCAADIRVENMEQLIRYAAILLDYADESHQDFDELLIERNRYGAIWLHFAVRAKENRRKIMFIKA